jgi:Zinc-finger of the MIZ type in Nse subunit.
MQNHLTSSLQEIYEANLRSLHQVQHERSVSKRILNTNDYIVNALTTLMCRRYGLVLPNLNSEESQTIPILPSPPPQMFVTPAPAVTPDLGSRFLDPIPVFPSPAQIREGTRDVTFSSLENPINDTCPILLNAFQPNEVVTQIRGCGHVFGRTPIFNWFRSSCRCPVCRFDVRTYVASDNENNDAIREYESTFSQNANAILNLLSHPSGTGAMVRDLSGNSFVISHDVGDVIRDLPSSNFIVRSFYDT